MWRIDGVTLIHDIEQQLQKALQNVEFIGELSIDHSTFEAMFKAMQRVAPIPEDHRWGHWKIKNIPKALFATTMVFCARYSEVDARNFWTPYANSWDLTEPDQSFQQYCREYFYEVRQWLHANYGFYFPSRLQGLNHGRVVPDIYTHAIIPYYLQNDFGNWLNKQDKYRLQQLSTREIVDFLQTSNSLRYEVPRFKSFMTSVETATTAAGLVKTMVTALEYAQAGMPVSEVKTMLKSIEVELWNMLATELKPIAPTTKTRSTRQSDQLRWQWVWSLDAETMQLMVTSATIQSAEKPARWVWALGNNAVHEAEQTVYIQPWRGEQQTWFIDETYLQISPQEGTLYLVGENNIIIDQYSIPAWQPQRIQGFRPTRQNSLGISIDLETQASNGDWLVLLDDGCRILDQSGNPIEPFYPKISPVAGKTGGFYTLTFPAILDYGDFSQTIEQTVQLTATLTGNTLANLASSVPPIFTNHQIQMTLNHLKTQRKHKYNLWVIDSNHHIERYSLNELEEKRILQSYPGESVQIDLSRLLPNTTANYQVDIRQNFESLLAEPLNLNILTDVTIVSPDLTTLYTPYHLPEFQFIGVDAQHILIEGGEVTPTEAGCRVLWHDLDHDCRFIVQQDHVHIPLAWDIQRFYAWLTPMVPEDFYTQRQLEQTVIHIRGPRKTTYALRVNQGRVREYPPLNRLGQADIQIRQNQLYEMMREEKSAELKVSIIVGGQAWQLFRLLRQPEIKDIETFYDSKAQELYCSFVTAQAWQGNFRLQLVAKNGHVVLDENFGEIFTTTLVFPCRLVPGNYQLHLFLDEKPIDLSNSAFIEVEDHIWQESDMNITDAQFERLPARQMPESGGSAVYLRRYAAQEELNADALYHLATMPSKNFLKLPIQYPQPIWDAIEGIRQIQAKKNAIGAPDFSALQLGESLVHLNDQVTDLAPMWVELSLGLASYESAYIEWQAYLAGNYSILGRLHDYFIDIYTPIMQTVSQNQRPIDRAIQRMFPQSALTVAQRQTYPLEIILLTSHLRSIAYGFRERYLSEKVLKKLLSLSHQHTPQMLSWSLGWAEVFIAYRSHLK